MNFEDLGPAELLFASAVGEPGQRTFFMHVRAGGEAHWFIAEKLQIDALADRSLELIDEAGHEPDVDAVMRISESFPVDPGRFVPRFRVVAMLLRATEGRELVGVELESAEGDHVRFEVAPEQLLAMAAHIKAVVHQGRPTCERCQLPIDPGGHLCPARNGHHPD